MDELRFRSQQSPRGNDQSMHSFVSPTRNASRMPAPQVNPHAGAHDHRSGLPRRFTTDSGRVPTLSSLGAQRVPESSQDYNVSNQHMTNLSLAWNPTGLRVAWFSDGLRKLPIPLITASTDMCDGRQCTRCNWYVLMLVFSAWVCLRICRLFKSDVSTRIRNDATPTNSRYGR